MRIGIHANMKKQPVRGSANALLDWLIGKGTEPVISKELDSWLGRVRDGVRITTIEELPAVSDVIVSLGGDGTMLSAARLIGEHEKPLVGINLGGLGFLTEITAEEMVDKMERILRGQYTIAKRMVLDVTVPVQNETRTYHVLNDVVIDRGKSPRVICVDVNIDGTFFNTYLADGLIVATPTGSTAYSLSAGGPIVVPALESIILNPICPHALTVRPTLISAESEVEITARDNRSPLQLSVDGQENLPVQNGDTVKVRKGRFYMHLITFREHSFFDLLRRKLQWGGLPHK